MTKDYVLIPTPAGKRIDEALLSLDVGQAYEFSASHKSSLTSRVSTLNRTHAPARWRTQVERLQFKFYVIRVA